jgi:hypothetical protein
VSFAIRLMPSGIWLEIGCACGARHLGRLFAAQGHDIKANPIWAFTPGLLENAMTQVKACFSQPASVLNPSTFQNLITTLNLPAELNAILAPTPTATAEVQQLDIGVDEGRFINCQVPSVTHYAWEGPPRKGWLPISECSTRSRCVLRPGFETPGWAYSGGQL